MKEKSPKLCKIFKDKKTILWGGILLAVAIVLVVLLLVINPEQGKDGSGATAKADEMAGADDAEPVITLIGDETIYVAKGGTFEDPGCTATDDVDGDLTDKVTVKNDVDVNTPGEYHVSYYAEDAAGNKARVRRKVTVTETDIDTYDLVGFDLRKYYPDVMCPAKEFNQENADVTYLLGDSFFQYSADKGIGNVDHIWGNGMLTPENVLTTPLYVGAEPTEYLAEQLIAMYQPEALVLMIGNHAVFGGNTGYFQSTSVALYDYLTATYPDLKIAICSLVPYDAESVYEHIEMWGFERQQRLNEFNAVICELCRQYGYKYMNVDEVLKNPETGYLYQEYVDEDDYHLSPAGYSAMMDYINRHLGW